MKNKNLMIVSVVAVVLAVVSVGIIVMNQPKKNIAAVVEEQPQEVIEPLASSVSVSLIKSKIKDNTIVMGISGMQSKYKMVAYELSYDSQGIVQGVTTKPLDVSGKDTFTRDDIYLGTCSRNVCRPHPGVKKISLVLEFTDLTGKKSQFSKDYDL